MSATMRIKKGDMVQIIAGKDKGKSGKIIAINHKKGVVYVEGLNMITKHTKPSMANQQGGIIHTEGPIDASNVMYLYDDKPARIQYQIVDGKKYLPVNEEGTNSEFQIPVTIMDESMPVIADTTAMGTPHEINYTLTFYSDSIGSKSQMPQEAAKRVVAVALVIIVGGGILNYFVNKRNRC